MQLWRLISGTSWLASLPWGAERPRKGVPRKMGLSQWVISLPSVQESHSPGTSLVDQWLESTLQCIGSISGQGTKIPHAAEQPSLCAATRQPRCCNQRACVPQQKIPYDTTKTRHSQINKGATLRRRLNSTTSCVTLVKILIFSETQFHWR